MPPLNNNFKGPFYVRDNKSLDILGLDSFVKNLEKSFFSELTVRNASIEANFTSLILEMNCNYELSEMIFHYNSGTWGDWLQRPQ